MKIDWNKPWFGIVVVQIVLCIIMEVSVGLMGVLTIVEYPMVSVSWYYWIAHGLCMIALLYPPIQTYYDYKKALRKWEENKDERT